MKKTYVTIALRLLIVIAVCTLLSVLILRSCDDGSEEKEEMIRQSEICLKQQLDKYYGMKEGSYTATVKEVDIYDSPYHGVVWDIKEGTTEFTVFLYGSNETDFKHEDYVRSNRYYTEFTDYAVHESERRIGETGIFDGMPFRVSVSFPGERDTRRPGMILPLRVTPDTFEDYLTNQLSRESGFSLTIRVFTATPYALTESQMQQLLLDLPVCEVTVYRYDAVPGEETDADIKGHHTYRYNQYSKKWEFTKIIGK